MDLNVYKMKKIGDIKRYFIDIVKGLHLYKSYNYSLKNGDHSERKIVTMIDGCMHHGGLSDRICGIVSSFIYAQEIGMKFELNYTYPYDLSIFLQPNLYDWSFSGISYNLRYSRPIYVSMFDQDRVKAADYYRKRIGKRPKQLHIYTNMYYFSKASFSENFSKLFKMSDLLKQAVVINLNNIGGKYVSITFRFQQLLGDFKETGFAVITDPQEKQLLIEKCLSCIEYLHSLVHCKILVTSDSHTFLELASKRYDFVCTIPGKVVHMDFVTNKDNIDIQTHLKSFVDFFLIANAQKIFLANIGKLYRSSFPAIASLVYCRDFFDIVEENNNFVIRSRNGI